MGDVALTVPVLRSALEQNPHLKITLVSNKQFESFFYDLPNFEFYGVDFDQYKGVLGLYKLFNQLRKYQKWDAVLDLHSVMRTWVLGTFFRWTGTKVYRINKGREQKKRLTAKQNKILQPLPHTTQRYQQVFRMAGIEFNLQTQYAIHVQPKKFSYSATKKRIGIAPFSKHQQKEWPLQNIAELIKQLAETNKYEFFLLGGGNQEFEKLNKLADSFSNVHNMVGKYRLAEEIAFIKQLSVLLTMDSFNMHLAALLGVKVVSIWGATHSFAGFGPLNQNEDLIVEVPIQALACRPCSVFGNKPCFRGDFACMQQISVEMVKEKLTFALAN